MVKRISEEEKVTDDPIVDNVIMDMIRRSDEGMKHYGTSMADNPMSEDGWLQELYEEILDAALYIKRLQMERKINRLK